MGDMHLHIAVFSISWLVSDGLPDVLEANEKRSLCRFLLAMNLCQASVFALWQCQL